MFGGHSGTVEGATMWIQRRIISMQKFKIFFTTLLALVTLVVGTIGFFSTAKAEEEVNGSVPNRGIYLPLVSGGSSSERVSEEAQAGRTNQIIVRFGSTVQSAAVDRNVQAAELSGLAGTKLTFVREMSGDSVVLRLPDWKSVADADTLSHLLMNAAYVEYAEPDAIMDTMISPNDPNYPQQWHYFSPSSGKYGANLPGAWDITTGASNVIIAVIDTGILTHADLNGITVPGYDFISDALVANDGDGRDSDPRDPGDWITSAESSGGFFQGCGIRNSSWHGSHVAGTIAGKSNNGLGVAGINWLSKVIPVRVLGKCGGYTSDIVDAIRWSAGINVTGVPTNPNPAKVINMSLGGSGACSSTSSYQLAINDALSRGTVVVVSAGNNNADAANYSPASCAGVITVASTGPTGSRAYYSNYGSTVEIAAPGGDTSGGSANGVLSTVNSGTTVPASDTYAYYQGTSMAAPHVAGIVSLMFSVNANLTPAQVINLIQSNVTAFPAGSTCTTSNCGPGIINAAAVVAAAQAAGSTPPANFAKSSPANGGSVVGNSVTLSWGTSAGASGYEYCVDTSNDNSCSASWTATTSTSAVVSSLAVGSTYYWQVRAVNTYGTTEANSSVWWSFGVTSAPAPGAFNKSSPANGASSIRVPVTLQWGSSSYATSYQVCISTSSSSCTAWQGVGNVTQFKISSLSAKTTYYWQVRALNSVGATEANGGTMWRFTTR